MRSAIGIILYVLFGLLFSGMCFALLPPPTDVSGCITPAAKILGALVLLLGALLLTGVLIRGRQRWRRDVGIVLISSGAYGAASMLMMALMFSDPELLSVMAESMPEQNISDMHKFFSARGIGVAAATALVGYLILRTAPKETPT